MQQCKIKANRNCFSKDRNRPQRDVAARPLEGIQETSILLRRSPGYSNVLPVSAYAKHITMEAVPL